MKLQVRSSLDFGTNLAAAAPVIAHDPGPPSSLAGFRSSGGNAHLYWATGLTPTSLSLDCSAAGPGGGGPGGRPDSDDREPDERPGRRAVFIGDQLRIKPSFSPPDAVSPLLDWRLDYDFHDGNAADSQATAMRLVNADASRTLGPALPPAELDAGRPVRSGPGSAGRADSEPVDGRRAAGPR